MGDSVGKMEQFIEGSCTLWMSQVTLFSYVSWSLRNAHLDFPHLSFRSSILDFLVVNMDMAVH